MVDRASVDKSLSVHFDLSAENHSFSGRPQNKVVNTNVGSVTNTITGKTTSMPSHAVLEETIEGTGLDLDYVQTVSGQAIQINMGETTMVDLGFIANLKESNMTLKTLEVLESNISNLVTVDGDSFQWSRLESEAEGNVMGGPRPFASAEIDVLFDIKSGELSQEQMADLEKAISEETRGGIHDISPDVVFNDDNGLHQVKTRSDEIYRESFEIMIREIERAAEVAGQGVDLIWIGVENL